MWEFYIFSLNGLQAHFKVHKACKKHMLSILPSQPLRKLTRPDLSTESNGLWGFQKEVKHYLKDHESIREAFLLSVRWYLIVFSLVLAQNEGKISPRAAAMQGQEPAFSNIPACRFNLNGLRFIV